MTRVRQSDKKTIFRTKIFTQMLGALQAGNSLQLIGMKRVGIDEMLRIQTSKFAGEFEKYGYKPILINLNGMNDVSMQSFWEFTYASLATLEINTTTNSAPLLAISQTISTLAGGGYKPLLIFSRFDRLIPVFTEDMINSLQFLLEENPQLRMIFTSYRDLAEMLDKQHFNAHITTKKIYVPPMSESETDYLNKLEFKLNASDLKKYNVLSGGHGLLFRLLAINSDQEAIEMLFAEIWDSLSTEEKKLLSDLVLKGKSSSSNESGYLVRTGLLAAGHLFSSLFAEYVKTLKARKSTSQELTKKEALLYDLLQAHAGQIITRESICQHVWAEVDAYGVSDWAIDRLMARLRNKLKIKAGSHKIATIRGRGFRLQVIN